MGNSLRDVKIRMNATRKTSQITKAMNMVSASKLRKAEKNYRNYQSFSKKIEDVVNSIVSSSDHLKHPMLLNRPVKRKAYIIITSDRGLAGPYNNAILKQLKEEVEGSLNSSVISVIGTKGFGYCKKNDLPIIQSTPFNLRDDVDFIDIVDHVNEMIKMYENEKIDELSVIYNHYINTITQEVNVKKILPIDSHFNGKPMKEYEYDQGKEKSLDLILPMYVQNVLYGLILDAKTSEHASRMNAMRNATDNASSVIEALRLIYNRTRQSAITTELTDIIGGANAVE